ncbi:hypothetical protein EIP86_007967 [Pleurotus ostreatoroseus]|nr:hypothetical protein EIP86_007967 [Pleurotus ostreatoroseus]
MSDSALDPASAQPAAPPAPAHDDHPPPDHDRDRDGRDASPASSAQSASPQHSTQLTYSGMPMHMYPFPTGLVQPSPARTKRRQVKNACTNCQKACKKCDDARPCLRCVKYGIAEECVDSQRKERQKGIKRGPYKKRDGKDRASGNVDPQQLDLGVQSGLIPAAIAATAASPPMPYMTPVGYQPFFGVPAPTKPGEAPAYTYPTQYYLAPFPMPAPPQPGQDGDAPAYPTGFYPIFAPYGAAPYTTPYMMAAPPASVPGRDGQPAQVPQPMPMPIGQMPMQMPIAQMPPGMAPLPGMPPMAQMQMQYAAYPQAAYPKPASVGPGAGARDGELGTPPQMVEQARREVRLDQYNGRMGEGMPGGHGKAA